MSQAISYENETPTIIRSPRGFEVRPACLRDRTVAMRLYHEGLLIGRTDPFDSVADLDQIEEFYNRTTDRRLWVAESGGEVVGMVAITIDDDLVAHLRRLRVTTEFAIRDAVALALVETAVAHAREHGAIKLVVHTPVEHGFAIDGLGRLGFQFAKTREIRERRAMEFYVNIYDRFGWPVPDVQRVPPR